MEELLRLNKEDLSNKINQQSLKTIRIIQAVLIIGPIVFLVVILCLYAFGSDGAAEREPGTARFMMTLLSVLGPLFVGTMLVAYFAPATMFSAKNLSELAKQNLRLPEGGNASGPVEWMLHIHRNAVVIRMAALEGSSLFGLVILLLGVIGNSLQSQPIIWFAALPLIVHVLIGLRTFPNKENVINYMDQHILQPLRRSATDLP